MTLESSGEVTRTTWLSWVRSVIAQPTPQYGHTVVVSCWRASSHWPSRRSSNSRVNTSAPVGQALTQLPQNTHALSGSGVASSVEMRASKPRPATAIA